MPTSVRLEAPAKLNLGLAILSQRPDGYHDLLSVFQAITWADTVEVASIDEGIHVGCSDPGLPTGRENLVWQAADLVRRSFRISSGVDIRVDKRIPAGAGLAGGSSDAAATMRGLARLWDIPAGDEAWLTLCAQIGSDVPFFWKGGTAIVEGRGERVTPLRERGSLAFVVAVPPVQVSTAWAYRQVSPPFPAASAYRRRVEALRRGEMNLSEFCRRLENTFQHVVEQHYPVVRDVRESLLASGATSALMSGSGSAVFGVFDSDDRARSAAQSVEETVGGRAMGTVVRVCRTAQPPTDGSRA